MHAARTTACALILALSSPALGQDPSCPELLNSQFESALDLAEKALTDADFGTARQVLAGSEERIPCIVEVVPTELLLRFATMRAYQQALDLDQSEATRWAKLAVILSEGDFDWPVWVPPDHEVRNLLDDIEIPERTSLRTRGLVVPEAGGAFLDGQLLARPEAEPGVPHLLQIGDAWGDLTVSRWIDGVAFPDEVLGPAGTGPTVIPAWYGVPRNKIPGKRSQRSKRLESALGFAVAGGALFGSAWIVRTTYDERPTDALFYTVNGTTVASGVAGVLSVGFLGAAALTRR
jgi:hypothetical protein